MKNLPLFLTALAFASAPALAHADTVFTSATTFAAATKGLTTVTYDGIATASGFVNEGFNFTIGGASVTSTQYLNINGPDYYTPNYNSGGYVIETKSAEDLVTISFAPSTAVGISLGGFNTFDSIPVTLSDGTSTVFFAPDSVDGTGALDFIGFTTNQSITSITLDFPANNPGSFDNLSFGASNTATPEPSSLILLATGLVGAAGAARRRLRS